MLAEHLEARKLLAATSVTRHQFLVHPDIPYTSHNSSACIAGLSEGASRAALAEVARGFLRDHFHDGANPGLCVCAAEAVPGALLALAERAQREVLRLGEFDGALSALDLELSWDGETGRGGSARRRAWRFEAPAGTAASSRCAASETSRQASHRRDPGPLGRRVGGGRGRHGARPDRGRRYPRLGAPGAPRRPGRPPGAARRSGLGSGRAPLEAALMRGPAAALRRLETREALLLAFFATFIVLAKAALRWHLQVPGHVMFATALFLILARGCVPRPGAATAVGLLAGLVCAALGMGKGGPLIVAKLVLPGLLVDAGFALPRGSLPETLRGGDPRRSGGCLGLPPGGGSRAPGGSAGGIVAQQAALSAGTKAAFGALGGWAAVAILRRLRDHGIIGDAAAPEA